MNHETLTSIEAMRIKESASILHLLPRQHRSSYALSLDIFYLVDFLYLINSELDPIKRVMTNSTGLNVTKVDGMYFDYSNVSF